MASMGVVLLEVEAAPSSPVAAVAVVEIYREQRMIHRVRGTDRAG